MIRTGILAGLALAAAAPSAWAAPKIQFISKTTHEFKTVYQGTPVAYGFFFKNTGNQTLVIEKVQADCGCTTARAVPEKIAPGAKGKISVIFDTFHYRGKQHKTVTITTNDPHHEKVTLTLSGTVKVAVDIKPSPSIAMLTVVKSEKKTRTFTVVALEPMKGFKVIKVEKAVPYIHVSAPRPSKKHKGGFDITVTLGPNAPVGRLGQDIIIHTNHKRQPKAAVRVWANVVAERK